MNESYEIIRDSSGKKVFYKNKQKKNTHLAVFVHGFTGNYLSTWGKLPDLLLNDPRLLHYDFLFWGYSSSLFFPKENFFIDNIKQFFTQILSRHKTNQRVEITAQGLQTELKYLSEYKNITLIGHSLGGLIIRSYIIQNLKENTKESTDRINRINNIILFGTPNEGLDIANNKFLGGFNNQIADIGSYNEFINSLREEWVERVFKNDNITFKTLMVAGEDDNFVPFEQVTKYFRDSRELTNGNHSTIAQPQSIHDTSYKIIANNLLQIGQKNYFEIHDNATIGYISNEQLLEILNKIKKLIADRGLDDASWTETLPSKYFLIKLARKLKLTKNNDYLNLLDSFLKNYYMKVDNQLILSDKYQLDTNIELAEIQNSMIEEDVHDDYYSRFNKSNAANIDINLLHNNYHYGLMTQIAYSEEFSNSLTLKLIRDLAIKNLIYGIDKKPTNDHGGWYPQRLPWLTARILIGLRQSGYETRNDKLYIEQVVEEAIEYLLRSVIEDKYWRSGISDWVSDWESTALCLEALDSWGKITQFRPKIHKIIDFILKNENNWFEEPNFDSHKNTNKTLASVTLICNLIIIANKHFQNSLAIDYNKYLSYLDKVLKLILASSNIPVHQYSTVHQIIYYVSWLIAQINNNLILNSIHLQPHGSSKHIRE